MEQDKTPREMILAHAADITANARNQSYGDPIPNHENIARFMRAYLAARSSSMSVFLTGDAFRIDDLDAEDAMAFAMILKIARIAQRRGDQYDSYVDLCAYAAMMGEAQQARLKMTLAKHEGDAHAYKMPVQEDINRHSRTYGTAEAELRKAQDMGVNK